MSFRNSVQRAAIPPSRCTRGRWRRRATRHRCRRWCRSTRASRWGRTAARRSESLVAGVDVSVRHRGRGLGISNGRGSHSGAQVPPVVPAGVLEVSDFFHGSFRSDQVSGKFNGLKASGRRDLVDRFGRRDGAGHWVFVVLFFPNRLSHAHPRLVNDAGAPLIYPRLSGTTEKAGGSSDFRRNMTLPRTGLACPGRTSRSEISDLNPRHFARICPFGVGPFVL